MEKANELVTKLLADRSAAHVAHWATGSYSAHVALAEFYDAVVDLVDGFVEQYQGYYAKRMEPKVVALSVTADGIDDMLELSCEWIEANRYKVCDRDDTSLQNTIDEVVKLYQTTLYKLRMLK
jgi:DUF1680 family protein